MQLYPRMFVKLPKIIFNIGAYDLYNDIYIYIVIYYNNYEKNKLLRWPVCYFSHATFMTTITQLYNIRTSHIRILLCMNVCTVSFSISIH